MTVEKWIEKAIEDRVGAPFDRVRLVDQASDVISPDLPEEDLIVEAEPAKKRKKGVLGRPSKQAVLEKDIEKPPRITFKLKIPRMIEAPKLVKRVKEIDSDGDTVGGWSDEENGGVEGGSALSSLASFSKSVSPVPARFAFPPRQSKVKHPNLNDYLLSIAEPVVQHDHYTPSTLTTLPAPLNHHEPLDLLFRLSSYSFSPPSHRLPPLPIGTKDPFVHHLDGPCLQPSWPSDLNLLSLAAAEARKSPSYEEFVRPSAHPQPPPSIPLQQQDWMDKSFRRKDPSEDEILTHSDAHHFA